MKLPLYFAVVVCIASVVCAGADSQLALNAQELSPQQLLDDMIARLPREPLAVSGDLILRKRHGVVIRNLKFQMNLDWAGQPATARYVIMDALGAKLEDMTVTRPAGREPQFKRSGNNTSADETTPNLIEPIQETDISWTDITLAFLWWKPEAITGKEDVRGRPCHIVEVVPPPSDAGNIKTAGGQYAKARLWIDEKLHMLLRADGLDSKGKIVRSLWVKSFKKIDDRWMIKDMEIQSSPAHRTKLVIHDVNGVNTDEKKELEP